MIRESSDPIKKHFNKERLMTKEDDEDFDYSTKFWIWDNFYVEGYFKVADLCHITGKCKGCA